MKKNNVATILICFAIVLLGIVVAVLGLLIINKPKSRGYEGIAQAGIAIDNNATTKKVDNPVINPLANRQVYFAGISDCIIGKENVIYLENPTENEDIYISYRISDSKTDEIIFETNLIPSGERVIWNPSECLTPGDYTLNFTQIPYWRADEKSEWQTLTNGNNAVNITLVE